MSGNQDGDNPSVKMSAGPGDMFSSMLAAGAERDVAKEALDAALRRLPTHYTEEVDVGCTEFGQLDRNNKNTLGMCISNDVACVRPLGGDGPDTPPKTLVWVPVTKIELERREWPIGTHGPTDTAENLADSVIAAITHDVLQVLNPTLSNLEFRVLRISVINETTTLCFSREADILVLDGAITALIFTVSEPEVDSAG
jgi:hypothetical protein